MASSEMFSFQCPSCSKQLRAPANAVGKRGRCKACGSEFPVPHLQTKAERTIVDTQNDQPTKNSPRKHSDSTGNIGKMLSQQKHSVDNEKHVISERALARASSSNEIDRAIEDLIAEGNRQLASVKRASLSSAEIAKAITSAVPRRSVSLAYRINLTLVASAMSILPN